MNDWNTMLSTTQERRDDLYCYVETERMLRQAFREGSRQRSFRRRALCALGRQLVALGARLQEAHGGASYVSALRPTPPGPA